MYTIIIKKFGENEPYMINVPTKEIACQIGMEVANKPEDEGDVQNLTITLDQSKHYVKSHHIYLRFGYRGSLPVDFPCEELDVSQNFVFTHTLDFFDWRNN